MNNDDDVSDDWDGIRLTSSLCRDRDGDVAFAYIEHWHKEGEERDALRLRVSELERTLALLGCQAPDTCGTGLKNALCKRCEILYGPDQ